MFQLLPTSLDIAKAVVVVIMLATAVRVAPHCAQAWRHYVRKHERFQSTHIVPGTPAVDAEYGSARQTEKRDENSQPEGEGREASRPSITVRAEFATTAHSELAASRSIARELPVHGQIVKQSSTPRFDHPPRTYFDNAGRSYASKVDRDAAEDLRLVESLRHFPAMKPEQRAIMRQRAFARLETLDAQHVINPAP